MQENHPVEEKSAATRREPRPTRAERERAVLVGIDVPKAPIEMEASLDELEQLALSAGVEVVGRLSQKLDEPNPRHYIGKGKLEELAALCQQTGAGTVIFDDELKPRVQQELEKALNARIVDRTLLILDIFAERAHTHEGRVQVELAQYKYLLPRLMGQGTQLSRLGAGIGTRGPGETKLETDRRRIRSRISKLEEEIDAIKQHRQVHRESRERQQLPVVALIGYTNVGKSTLLNRLTGSDVEVANKLFATLDPTTRKLKLPSGQEVLLSDTVGFIAKLPTTLVAAFRATLEELKAADLLLLVVDISDPQVEASAEVVRQILSELKLNDKLIITVLNKADRLMPEAEGEEDADLAEMTPEALGLGPIPDTVLVSATSGFGLDQLRQRIEDMLNEDSVSVEIEVPYKASDMVDFFRRRGVVEDEEHTPAGTLLRGRIPARYLPALQPYRVHAGAKKR